MIMAAVAKSRMKAGDGWRYYTVSVLFTAVFLFRILWSPGAGVPLKKELSDFPLKIEGWTGHDSALDEDVLKILGLTDYILRDYYPEPGASRSKLPINLYVGYYDSLGKGKTYHSPKNCLPGSGWEIVDSDRFILETGGDSYNMNKVIIQKGLERQLVVYWFQDRGRIIASEYWAKIYLVYDSIFRRRTDGTFVRVVAPIIGSVDETLSGEVKFIKMVMPILKEHLPD